MRLRPLSLRWSILLAVLVTVAPVVALSVYHANGIRHQQRTERRAEALRLGEQAAAGLGRYLEGTRQLLVALAHDPAVRTLDSPRATLRLRELKATSPLFANLLLVDAHGTALASAVPLPNPVNVADRSYFLRLQHNRRLGLGEYQIGRITGRPVINLACPLPDQAPEGPLACVVAALELSILEQLLDDFPRPADTGLFVLDRGGVLVAQRGTGFAGDGQRFPDWAGLPRGLQFSATDHAGRRQLVRLVSVPSLDEGIWLGVAQPEAAVAHDERGAFLRSLGLTSLGTLAALLLAWGVAERLVLHPTRRLTDAAAALAAGDWRARARFDHGAAELRALGSTYNAMAEHLHGQLLQLAPRPASETGSPNLLEQAIAAQHAADTALRRSEATARAFIDALPETALLLTPDGTILMTNQTAAERLRRPQPALIGTNIAAVMSPELYTSRRAHLETVLATREPVVFEDQRNDRILRAELRPVLDPAGTVVAVAVLSFDITDRQRMEERLRRSVAELEQALAEVRTLSGLLPICACCKKIRDDRGYWSHVEQYLTKHTRAEFSHGLCPDCLHRLYPEYTDEPPPEGAA